MTGTLHTAALTAIGSAITGTASRTLGNRFTDIINVKDFGATGNGSTDDTSAIQAALDAAYGTTGSPHGDSGKYTNKAVFFPNGSYKITAALTLRSVRGGWIYGAGRESTRIFNATTNGSVFVTNGFDYSRVEGLTLVPNGTGIAFDLDWDNTGSTALQANTFAQNAFGGSATGIGVRIGNTGYMGSENLFLNNHFTQLGTGVHVNNFNALQNTMIGGNFQSCNFGIKVSSGSMPLIASTGFQVSGTYDVQVDGGTAADSLTMLNCRSESPNFLNDLLGAGIQLIGCGQTQGTAGDFVRFNGPLTMIGCYSANGRVVCPAGNAGALYGTGNSFGRSDWLQNNQASIAMALSQGFNSARMMTDSSGNLVNATFVSLPAASSAAFGALVPVYDSSTSTPGATITGAGSNKVLAFCNGTNWIVK